MAEEEGVDSSLTVGRVQVDMRWYAYCLQRALWITTNRQCSRGFYSTANHAKAVAR
jgi:hypothetical protein